MKNSDKAYKNNDNECNDDSDEESNHFNSLNYYNLDKSYLEHEGFVDYINDLIFYIGTNDKNAFIIKTENISNLEIDVELLILICFVIKVKGLKSIQAIEYIKEKIESNQKTSVFNDDIDLEIIQQLENNKKIYQEKLDSVSNGVASIIPFIEKFESSCFLKDEFTYKCSSCRKNIFKDSDIESYHKYTPKIQYSFKRYKKSFVNKAECSSYFLKNVEKIFCAKKEKDKLDNKSNSKTKYSYEYEDFYSTMMSTKLNCLHVRFK